MKNLFTLFILLALTKFTSAGDLDSLRQHLKTIQHDSLKAPVYAQIATEYMQFDTISSRVKKMVYQNEAILNSYQALHIYTKYSDTTGMRNCYDNLAVVFQKQQRYSQAKWFTLQSTNLSRIKSDAPNLIASLKQLAAIKSSLKEYKMAENDLKEASHIAKFGYTYVAPVDDSVKNAVKIKKIEKKKAVTASVKKSKTTKGKSAKPARLVAVLALPQPAKANIKVAVAAPSKKLAAL